MMKNKRIRTLKKTVNWSKNKNILIMLLILPIAAIFIVNMQGSTADIINITNVNFQGSITTPSDGTTISTSSVSVKVYIPEDTLETLYESLYVSEWSVTVYNSDMSDTQVIIWSGGGAKTLTFELPYSGAYTIKLIITYYWMDYTDYDNGIKTNIYYSSFSTTAGSPVPPTPASVVINSPSSITLSADEMGDIRTMPVSFTVTRGYYMVSDITIQIDDNVQWSESFWSATGEYTKNVQITATAGTSEETTDHELTITLHTVTTEPDVVVVHSFSVTWIYVGDEVLETAVLPSTLLSSENIDLKAFVFNDNTTEFVVDVIVDYRGSETITLEIALILSPTRPIFADVLLFSEGKDSPIYDMVIIKGAELLTLPYHFYQMGTVGTLAETGVFTAVDWGLYPTSNYYLIIVMTGDGVAMKISGISSGGLLAPSFELPLIFGVLIAIVIKRRKQDE